MGSRSASYFESVSLNSYVRAKGVNMKMRHGLLLTFIFSLGGCVSSPAPPMLLDPGAEKVQVAKSDPSDNYEIVGPVTGLDGKGCGLYGYMGSYERATTSLRNKTLKMGGNYAQIITLTEPHLSGDCFNNQYVIRATAYKKTKDHPTPTQIFDASEEEFTKKCGN